MDQEKKMDYHVLYVYDEQSSVNSFENLFRRKFNIITASLGQEGLEILKNLSIPVVITDQRIPDMTGVEFINKVKNIWPDIKCILFTAYDGKEVDDKEAIKTAINEAGIYWYLNKPFEPEQLEQIITNASSSYHTEKKLKENEEKFREVFESMIDVFSRSDMNGKCVLISPSVYNLLLYKPEEIIGRTLTDFYADPKQRAVLIDELKSTEGVKNFEGDLIRKDGKVITVSVNARMRYNSMGQPLGIEGIFRDVTEKKQAERELRERETMLSTLLNAPFEIIMLLNRDGTVLSINESGANRFDKTPEAMIGRNIYEFMEGEVLQQRKSYGEEVFRTGMPIQFYDEREGNYLDNSVYPVFDTVGEKVVNIAIFASDITERKKAEIQILDYQKRLKALANELTLAEEKIRKQIAVDLHDHVGQLLASIRMQLARIIDLAGDGEIANMMNNISLALVKAIQATRAAIFDLSPPQLNEIGLYAAAHDWIKEQIEKKHSIKTRITGEEEEYDLKENTRFLLFRSIKELMTNAVKHAKANQITLAMKRKEDFLEINVEDDGVGFNYNSDLLRLRSDVYGLFSIQERITDLGGSIEVDSVIGKGTKVKLVMPLKDD